MDRLPEILKSRDLLKAFLNIFALYLDGVLSQSEFYELANDLVDPNCAEQFQHLQTLIAQRDNSRRDIFEASQFKLSNMLTRSYYIFSDDYVAPMCSGRYKPTEHAL